MGSYSIRMEDIDDDGAVGVFVDNGKSSWPRPYTGKLNGPGILLPLRSGLFYATIQYI